MINLKGMENKYNSLIFLDFDGVLNCQLFYDSPEFKIDRYQNDEKDPMYNTIHNCSPKRIEWLNDLCKETNSAVVVSATLRSSFTVEELQVLFNRCGGTFDVIGKTGHCDCRIRGVEIKQWLEKNSEIWFGVPEYNFYRYAIIDDDSDMLLWQQSNFFKVDNYSGLTPTTCYLIKRFFLHKAF
jgi:hypothetical protein